MIKRILFLLGILVMIIGQLLLIKGNDYVYQQKPIDFAHWFILSGTALMIPQIISFPLRKQNYIAIPLAFIGAICIIGMCVLDFIWWSFPDEVARQTFTSHISQVPSIWKPFIEIGPSSKVFNLGLLLLSFTYFKSEKVGVLLIAVATLVLWHIIPIPYRLVFGYSLTLIGFCLIFWREYMPVNLAHTNVFSLSRDV